MTATVTTSYGQLQGIDQGRSLAFKGIPFAAPPVGERRFAPPVPPQRWDGVLDATQFQATSLQVPNEGLNTLLPDLIPDEPQDEDCLYLNVWTPAADGVKRPVLFWIHGGAFTMGSGSPPLYDGSRLAERGDVVVVTINYRLGALGFLCLPEGAAGEVRTNFGILDQIQALRWVRDEIANFGGDPNNITIFGESAGAMSVGSVLVSPLARGLFQRAIPQSGAGHNALSVETASETARLFAEIAGVNLQATQQAIQALRALPVASILEAQAKLEMELLNSMSQGRPPEMSFQPVIDGHLLTMLPLEAVRAGHAADISILIGTTGEESKLMTGMVGGLELSDEALAVACAGRVTSPEDIATGIQVRDTYRQARAARGEKTSNHDVYVAVDTDYMFRIPADRFAEAQTAHNSQVYTYRLDWQSPLKELGACHALDLPFVFGTQAEPGIADFAGPGATPLAEKMMDAWIAFARSGDPSTTGLPWPKFEASQRSTMLLDAECRVVESPREEERLCWEGKR